MRVSREREFDQKRKLAAAGTLGQVRALIFTG